MSRDTNNENDNDNIITTPRQLTRAVATRSPAQALALAVRQALRTLPLLSLWLDWDEEEAIPAVLPTVRPLAAAHAMALAQAAHEAARHATGDAARLLPGAEEAGLLAADVEAAIRHATSAISRATSVVAKRRTQQAFMHTRNACAAAVRAAYAASAGSDANASARALSHMAQLFDGWQAISADLSALDASEAEEPTRAEWLLGQPLWLTREPPGWASEGWQAMRDILQGRENEHWQVWTRWYDTLLDPGPAFTRADDALPAARARLQLPEAFWKEGPRMANPAIAELLAAQEEQQARAVREAAGGAGNADGNRDGDS